MHDVTDYMAGTGYNGTRRNEPIRKHMPLVDISGLGRHIVEREGRWVQKEVRIIEKQGLCGPGTTSSGGTGRFMTHNILL